MEIRITKTSAQAKAEKAEKTMHCICPECGFPNLWTYTNSRRWFNKFTVKNFACCKCGCEWEVRG